MKHYVPLAAMAVMCLCLKGGLADNLSRTPARLASWRAITRAPLGTGFPCRSIGGTGGTESTQYSGTVVLRVGGRPYPFSATDLSGNPVSLNQYRGKVLLLDFWATWWRGSRQHIPNVLAAYNKFHGKGFDVLGVSMDFSRRDVSTFIKYHHMPYREVFDGGALNSQLAAQYQVYMMPRSFLIGRNGEILAIDPEGNELARDIKAALANKEPSIDSGAAF